jgi:hypothetical protein
LSGLRSICQDDERQLAATIRLAANVDVIPLRELPQVAIDL